MMRVLHSSAVGPFQVYYRYPDKFRLIAQEVFEEEEYHFIASNDTPLIFDCGSYIGLSILYHKLWYPDARIVAFEPDPDNLEVLKTNITANDLSNVTVVPKAVAGEQGTACLYREMHGDIPATCANTLLPRLWGDSLPQQRISVETVKLSDYVTGPVDFLKLDVEGLEEEVLEELGAKLHLVREIALEYHGTMTSRDKNSLVRIEATLVQYGFTVAVEQKDCEGIFPQEVEDAVQPDLALVRAWHA